MKDQHLISRDELLAAGALDVPAAWRKSLCVVPEDQPDLFSGLLDENERPVAVQQPAPSAPDRDGSAR